MHTRARVYIADDDSPRGDRGAPPDRHTVDHDGAHAHGRAGADDGVAADVGSGIEDGRFLDDDVVAYETTAIDERVDTDRGGATDDGSGPDDPSISNDHPGAQLGGRMHHDGAWSVVQLRSEPPPVGVSRR